MYCGFWHDQNFFGSCFFDGLWMCWTVNSWTFVSHADVWAEVKRDMLSAWTGSQRDDWSNRPWLPASELRRNHLITSTSSSQDCWLPWPHLQFYRGVSFVIIVCNIYISIIAFLHNCLNHLAFCILTATLFGAVIITFCVCWYYLWETWILNSIL